jgi:tartrate dehydrogenase/decarboxylase/D-malate dehydrogenase
MKEFRLAAIPGDGIGPEVMREGFKVLEVIEQIHGSKLFQIDSYDWNCEYYIKTGRMMPENGLDTLKSYDALLLGAIGAKGVPDHVSVWELILPIRREFQQYINLRPIKLLKGIESPLKGKGHADLDFVVVRENTEGEYSNSGGSIHKDTPYETVIQNSMFTRFGTERVARFAYELAQNREARDLVVATKSNAINHAMPFWDETIKNIGKEYPEVTAHYFHIDALAAYFITRPETFDVIVASNLFGDILTDLGAAIVGGLGIAPSGNINPEKQYPSMFEPIHGSAPDIAGKGIANPVGQIWSISMMLDYLECPEYAKLVIDSIEDVLEEGEIRTPDLGGKATTIEVGDAIVEQLLKRAKANKPFYSLG